MLTLLILSCPATSYATLVWSYNPTITDKNNDYEKYLNLKSTNMYSDELTKTWTMEKLAIVQYLPNRHRLEMLQLAT